MQETKIGREKLNAYVDGELPRDEEARVARTAAQNPFIAAQIATLRELKAAVPDIVPERDIALPDKRKRAGGNIAVAAAVGMLMFMSAALLHLFLQAEPEGAKWARFLQSYHNAWSFSRGEAGAEFLPASGPAGLLPLDLESARLTFVGYQEISFSGQRVVRTGYEGTRGCRVSLFVYPADVVLDQKVFADTLLVRKWEILDQGFALMADGMARTRFEGLARAVEKALREGAQPDPRMRQRLAQARRTSPPCQA